ncbi:MAG: DUF2961 domain-containing protein [Ktedonobacteraceae bacterium]|nr:DUF2961 domain-containing protein [Ktedonobacteraceae bacterium]
MRHYSSGRVVLVSLFVFIIVLLSVHFWPGSSSHQSSQPCKGTRALQNTSSSNRANGALAAPPLYLGFDAYRHLDKLSYLEMGDRVEGQSTADPAGTNNDRVHYLRALPDGEHVLFDQVGPGIVTFLRMQENYGAPWNLSLDGQAASTITTGDLGQMDPAGGPARAFPYPLSLNQQESQGSSILATAIPFNQSMMWTSQHANGNFYSIYRKLPYGSTPGTWNSNSDGHDVADLLRCAGNDIAPATLAQQSGKLTLGDGKETPVVDLAGPSQIRALTFQVPASEMASFGNARLLIYWDGEAHPSVDAPIKFLVGDGAGVYQPADRPLVQGWIAGANSDASGAMHFNLYWPMPFASSAHIAMLSDAPLSNVVWNVGYEPFSDPQQWWGTFHATYSSVLHPQVGQDMTFLDVRGSGKLVGTVINFGTVGGTLEGDPHIYVDDSKTPQIAGTGTEEWGLGGNYWNGGKQVSLPLGGLPSSTDNPAGSDQDGAALYRFLIADAISFNRHLVVHWEHGGTDGSPNAYRATMLWYGTATQTAQLSDRVSPALQASRIGHHYQTTGEQGYQMTAAYEYPVHNPLITMRGTATTGTTSFTLKLDPHNVGAFLRRTFDDCVANQRANIYLDNSFAGTWYDAGASNGVDVDGHRRCWRDEDFPLPASLTTGKSAVTVRIEFVPTTDPQNSAWTASGYQMYSFVLP